VYLDAEDAFMTTSELRDYATVAAATIALLVFLFNSWVHRRNQRIENLARFFEVHARMFAPNSFLMRYLVELEAGTFRRDLSDTESERAFHSLLLQVEQLAILAKHRAVPQSTQIYMLGLHARQIRQLLTAEDRKNMFWELAIGYLNELAELTDAYERMTPEERKRFQQ
jgi:hypothetical protein